MSLILNAFRKEVPLTTEQQLDSAPRTHVANIRVCDDYLLIADPVFLLSETEPACLDSYDNFENVMKEVGRQHKAIELRGGGDSPSTVGVVIRNCALSGLAVYQKSVGGKTRYGTVLRKGGGRAVRRRLGGFACPSNLVVFGTPRSFVKDGEAQRKFPDQLEFVDSVSDKPFSNIPGVGLMVLSDHLTADVVGLFTKDGLAEVYVDIG